MGIELDIYSYYLVTGRHGCEHHLLLRNVRPGSSNAVQPEVDQAEDAFDAARQRLLDQALPRLLAACGCAGEHTPALAGQCAEVPVGDALFADHAGVFLDVWIVQTTWGPPFVFLGAAQDEESFWQQLKDEYFDDSATLRLTGPASHRRVYFVTETDRT
jgi:hypothetical protein